MNENVKDLLKNATYDTSGKWIRADSIDKVLEDALQTCVKLVENTPTKCAFTTYDLGVVECTIVKAVEQITEHFNIKKTGVMNERTMG